MYNAGRSVRGRSARLGSARLGPVRLGLAWLGSDRPSRLGSARDRFGSPTRRTVRIWVGKALGQCWARILRLSTSRNANLDGFEKHFPGSRDDLGTAAEPFMSARLHPLQSRISRFIYFFVFLEHFANFRIHKVPAIIWHAQRPSLRRPTSTYPPGF